jgi:hypothetical protein
MKPRFAVLTTGLLTLAGYMLTMDSVSADTKQSAKLAVTEKAPAVKPPPKEAEKKKVRPKLPGQALWDLQNLEASFTVVGFEFDHARWQITWELEAKKKVCCPGYHAVFLDPDKVQMANVYLEFAPSKKEYDKGTRLKAVLPLPPREEFEESCTVTVHLNK